MTEIEKLQEQVDALQKQIDLMKTKESEVKPLGFGDLKQSDKFYIVNVFNNIDFQIYEKDIIDSQNIILGNAFKTKKQAEAYIPRYTRKLEILEWLHRNRDFENGTCFLMYHKKNDQITYYQDCNNLISQYPLNNPHEAIDLFGDDLKLIFDL
jgi:hypothetical protein